MTVKMYSIYKPCKKSAGKVLLIQLQTESLYRFAPWMSWNSYYQPRYFLLLHCWVWLQSPWFTQIFLTLYEIYWSAFKLVGWWYSDEQSVMSGLTSCCLASFRNEKLGKLHKPFPDSHSLSSIGLTLRLQVVPTGNMGPATHGSLCVAYPRIPGHLTETPFAISWTAT